MFQKKKKKKKKKIILSSQEIEEFARTGVRPEPTKGTQPWSGGASGGSAASAGTHSATVSAKFAGGGKFGGKAGAGAGGAGGGAALGTAKFPRASGPGEEAFKKYDEGDKWKVCSWCCLCLSLAVVVDAFLLPLVELQKAGIHWKGEHCCVLCAHEIVGSHFCFALFFFFFFCRNGNLVVFVGVL